MKLACPGLSNGKGFNSRFDDWIYDAAIAVQRNLFGAPHKDPPPPEVYLWSTRVHERTYTAFDYFYHSSQAHGQFVIG